MIGVHIFFLYTSYKGCPPVLRKKRGDAREFKIKFLVKVLLHVSSCLFFSYLQKSRVATKSDHFEYIHRILRPCSSSKAQKSLLCIEKSPYNGLVHIGPVLQDWKILFRLIVVREKYCSGRTWTMISWGREPASQPNGLIISLTASKFVLNPPKVINVLQKQLRRARLL